MYIRLLAASAQNRCTSLVLSCYVPSKINSHKGKGEGEEEEEEEKDRNRRRNNTKKGSFVGRAICKDHHGEVCNYDEYLQIRKGNHQLSDPTPLKSNLKKISRCTSLVGANLPSTGSGTGTGTEAKRKVSWPDAYGKDIAHVQEFFPSKCKRTCCNLGATSHSCADGQHFGSPLSAEAYCSRTPGIGTDAKRPYRDLGDTELTLKLRNAALQLPFP